MHALESYRLTRGYYMSVLWLFPRIQANMALPGYAVWAYQQALAADG